VIRPRRDLRPLPLGGVVARGAREPAPSAERFTFPRRDRSSFNVDYELKGAQ